MRRVLRKGFQKFQIIDWHERHPDDSFKKFRNKFSALGFLRGFMGDHSNMMTLRSILGGGLFNADFSRLSDHDVLDQLAWRLVSGQIRITVLPVTTYTWAYEKVAEEEEIVEQTLAVSPKSPPKSPETAWVKFQIVDDATGEPISGVNLKIKLPDGSQKDVTTRADGTIEFNGIEPGDCEATCEIKGATLKDTFSFVGLSEAPSVDGSKGKTAGKAGAGSRLALIEEHKVRTGESLESLASVAGMTWQELAEFNWGTSVPKEINRHLRLDVGCSKKTADGKNYILDSSDDPGIIYIPKVWSQGEMATQKMHTLRVKMITGEIRFHYQIDVDAPEAKNDTITLESEDGSWSQTIPVSDLEEFEPDWVELVFPKPPPGARYTMIQDPGDGKDPFYVFEGFTYEELLEEEPQYGKA